MIPPLILAKNDVHEMALLPALANRHGCITGATGTGKTVTLQALAQALSGIGVPVFMADVKGDLAGISQPGSGGGKVQARLQSLGLPEPRWEGCPVTYWDVFGEAGHPVRATISDLGPLLLGRMLDLNETQSGVLQLAFRVADDQGLLLLDLKDLRAMLQHVALNASALQTEYGNVSAASIGAIQRALLTIEEQGGDLFFGEPMLDVDDLLQTDGRGRGVVNVLAAERLMHSPRLYSTFLLWMLSELFERLPEVGDVEKPRLVFFFDEAHLLFAEAPKVLLQKIEQVVRLIRSKGVGVYFVTQNPLDLPDTVLGQLGNRVQHALRAFTPRDQKAVQAAADTFRPNPALDVARVITELGVGEALVSFLDEKGTPAMVQRAFVIPPASRLGPVTADERRVAMAQSLVAGVYEQPVDRESAYEKLRGRGTQSVAASGQGTANPRRGEPSLDAGWGRSGERRDERRDGEPLRPTGPEPDAGSASIGDRVQGALGDLFGGQGSRRKDSVVEAVMKSAARSIGSSVGREIVRGVLGSLLRRK